MKTQVLMILCAVALALAGSACAKQDLSSAAAPAPAPVQTAVDAQDVAAEVQDEDSALDELDPYASDIDAQLESMDQAYEQETGVSAFLPELNFFGTGCRREACQVYARVSKSSQRMDLYVNGTLQGSFATSTGVAGRGTPNMDQHPNGRVYDRYTSTKFPGGDYNGLGNMPYAVFIKGGFAIHGTGKGNWSKLGKPASHGCIRIHPDNAYRFNRLVRQVGASNTWITVQ